MADVGEIRSKTHPVEPKLNLMTASDSHQDPSLRLLYLACVVLGGVVTHLISEFAAMGSDADRVALSPRHLYLGVAAIVAILIAIRELVVLRSRAKGGRDAKRLAELGLASLPFNGKRHFWIITACLQLAVGGVTEIGEGCPLCGHDIVAGVGGALLGAIVLALLARALGNRLPSIASALSEFVPLAGRSTARWAAKMRTTPVARAEFLWFARLLNRPPPVLASSLNR